VGLETKKLGRQSRLEEAAYAREEVKPPQVLRHRTEPLDRFECGGLDDLERLLGPIPR